MTQTDFATFLSKLAGTEVVIRSVEPLVQHASARSYVRVRLESRHPRFPTSLVLMLHPQSMRAPSELGGGAATGEHAFLEVQRYLSGLGLPVPKVLGHDDGAGLIALEDLGDETFEARLLALPPSDWPRLYNGALQLLAQFQHATSTSARRCLAHERAFDAATLRAELEHFREWGLEAVYGPLDADAARTFAAAADTIVGALLEVPQVVVHRDFQSRNLMWAPRTAAGELVMLDFQDALLGPAVYDSVALLFDSYIKLEFAFQRAQFRAFVEASPALRGHAARAETWFFLQCVQRKLKDAGRFVFIDRVRGNPAFLKHYSLSLEYVGRALGELPELFALRTLLEQRIPGFPDSVPTPPVKTATRG